MDASFAVATALWRIGYIHSKAKDWPAAVHSYQQALGVRETIDATDPNDARNQKETELVSYRLGDTYLDWAQADKLSPAMFRSRVAEARRWFQRSLTIWSKLRQRDAAGPEAQSHEEEITSKLNQCDRVLATAAE